MDHIYRDGGSRPVHIKGADLMYPPLTLTMRYVTQPQLEAHNDEFSDCEDKSEARKLQQDFIAKQIVSWDATEDGKPVKPTAELVHSLHPGLYNRLCNIVFGLEGGDPLPKTGEMSASRDEQEGN